MYTKLVFQPLGKIISLTTLPLIVWTCYSIINTPLLLSPHRDDWLDNLQRASSPLQLRSCLGELESVIIPGFLTKEYVRHPRVVLGAYTSEQSSETGTSSLPESSAAR